MNRSVVMAFLMVLSVAALSRERRTCTVEAITNNCTEIGEDSDAQDPWFPERPMVSDSASEIIILGGGDSDKEKVLQVQKVNLDAQANIVRKLRTGSPHFLLAISSPLNLASISELSKKRKGASSRLCCLGRPTKQMPS